MNKFRINLGHASYVRALLVPCMCVTPLAAEVKAQALEEVFVTAQKRQESLQDIPVAVSSYTGDDLIDSGVYDMMGFVHQSPHVYGAPYPLANTILTVYMRGQGNNDPMQITKDGSIGVYENGIYNPRPQSIVFDLADVERVEVLRGPQGTLYGRNTTGGAMNIISRAPTGEFGIRQRLTVGERQRIRSVTNIDLPRIGDLLAKVTIAAGQDDGYVKNVGSSNNFNQSSHFGHRLALLWEPSERFSADYAYSSADIDTTPNYLSNPGLNGAEILEGVTYRSTKFRTYRPVDLPESPTKLDDHTLTLTWTVSDRLAIKSLTGLRDLDLTNFQDTVEAYGLGLPVQDYLESEQFSQEIQFLGDLSDRIEYSAGIYYYEEDAQHLQTSQFIIPGVPTIDSSRFVTSDAESRALYAQVSWLPPAFDDRLKVTVGARYTKDKRDASRDYSVGGFVIDDGAVNDLEFSRSTPSFALSYEVSDAINTYFKVSSGYRAGGSSESGSDFTRTFGPETVETYEAGVKADWLNQRLRTNLAVFYSNYEDIQLDVTPDPDNITITQTFNAGEASISGLELDARAVVTERMDVTLGFVYLDSEVDEVSVPGSDVSAGDFVIPYAPENSVTLAVDYALYEFDGGSVRAHLNYAWKSSAFNTSGAGPNIPGRNFYRTDGFGLLNGKLIGEFSTSVTKEPVRVSLWATNLLDIDDPIYTSAIGASNTGYVNSNHFWAEPRTLGVDLEFAF